MGRYGDGALVKLHCEADPISGLDLQGLLQHSSCLLPVGVLTEGADTDVLVQVDLVPKGNSSYSACRRSLDLGNIDYCLIRYFTVHKNGQLEFVTITC